MTGARAKNIDDRTAYTDVLYIYRGRVAPWAATLCMVIHTSAAGRRHAGEIILGEGGGRKCYRVIVLLFLMNALNFLFPF